MLLILIILVMVWYAGYVVGRYKSGGLFGGMRARLRVRRADVRNSIRVDQ